MGKVLESIFSGKTLIIPLAEVQHIEKYWYNTDDKDQSEHRGINVITSKTTWNQEIDCYNNAIYIPTGKEEKLFMRDWRNYRAQLEPESLADLAPQK